MAVCLLQTSRLIKKLSPTLKIRELHTKRKVLRSSCTDVYRNLAIEDALFQKCSDEEEILILWRNSPCVVIGRHQNAWVEANLPFLRQNNINIARRNSGGGTVFHDLGNINLSFITNKQKYNRRKNLELICAGLKNIGLDPVINERDDILLNGNKISGTAAKISRNKAYHHCTILVDVDRGLLSSCLKNPHSNTIKTNATKSVRSPVENISKESHMVDVEDVEAAIAQQFSPTAPIMDVQQFIGEEDVLMIEEKLKSWAWIFGKSPRFKFEDDILLNGEEFPVTLSIVNGMMEDIFFFNHTMDIKAEQRRFTSESILDIAHRLRDKEKELMLALLHKINKIT